jgi:hypothetical protein
MRPSAAVSSFLFVGSLLAGIVVGLLGFSGTHDLVAFFVPFVGGLLLGIVLAASVKIVAQWERMIVLRLGRFQAAAEPGLRLLIPIFDTAMFVDMRVQTVPIAQQQAITLLPCRRRAEGAHRRAGLPFGDLAPRAGDAP